MIKSWKNSATRRFAETGKCRFSGMDQTKAFMRLASLDAAVSVEDMGRLKSVSLHTLSGDRAGFWSVTINGPWRLVFRFEDGHAFDVEIVDYH